VGLIWTSKFQSNAGFHVSTGSWFPPDTFSMERLGDTVVSLPTDLARRSRPGSGTNLCLFHRSGVEKFILLFYLISFQIRTWRNFGFVLNSLMFYQDFWNSFGSWHFLFESMMIGSLEPVLLLMRYVWNWHVICSVYISLILHTHGWYYSENCVDPDRILRTELYILVTLWTDAELDWFN
jgi:hypothetical protein